MHTHTHTLTHTQTTSLKRLSFSAVTNPSPCQAHSAHEHLWVPALLPTTALGQMGSDLEKRGRRGLPPSFCSGCAMRKPTRLWATGSGWGSLFFSKLDRKRNRGFGCKNAEALGCYSVLSPPAPGHCIQWPTGHFHLWGEGEGLRLPGISHSRSLKI